MVDYGGKGTGDFIKGVGVFMNEVQEAVKENRVWLPDTKYYRKYIYDPEQTREEEREEEEEEEKQMKKELAKKEEEILETKETSANTGANINESILNLLKNFDRYWLIEVNVGRIYSRFKGIKIIYRHLIRF
jgi:sugar-specific transcriptional regulator TrmB